MPSAPKQTCSKRPEITTDLFRSQMGMTGNRPAYRELRKTLKEIVDECLDVARTAGSQTPESWAAFKSELRRRYPQFLNTKAGAERMKSAIFFAKEDIRKRRVKRGVKTESPEPKPDLPISNAESLGINARHAVDVLAFLEGCNPPLPFLLPHFIEAGIDERGWLWAMQEWPKSALKDFLASNFTMQADGSPDEKKVAVQALLNHFDDYE